MFVLVHIIIMFMHVIENGNPEREDGCLVMM